MSREPSAARAVCARRLRTAAPEERIRARPRPADGPAPADAGPSAPMHPPWNARRRRMAKNRRPGPRTAAPPAPDSGDHCGACRDGPAQPAQPVRITMELRISEQWIFTFTPHCRGVPTSLPSWLHIEPEIHVSSDQGNSREQSCAGGTAQWRGLRGAVMRQPLPSSRRSRQGSPVGGMDGQPAAGPSRRLKPS